VGDGDINSKMCKKTKYHKTSNTRIDECIRPLIKWLKDRYYKPISSCCGHGKYKMTIVVRARGNRDFIYELFSGKALFRTKKFYKRDKQGYYYIPEVHKL